MQEGLGSPTGLSTEDSRQHSAIAADCLYQNMVRDLDGSDLTRGEEAQIGVESVVKFTQLILDGNGKQAERFIDKMIADDVQANEVLGNMFPESARLLGQKWVDDECSFVDVSLGLAAMHRLLHAFSPLLTEEVSLVEAQPIVLITPIPGEQHIFAASLLGEYFRASSWIVHSGIKADWSTLVRQVSFDYFDVVCVTVSHLDKIDDCFGLISDLRKNSQNRHIAVLAGGPPFQENPSLTSKVGADATASDAMEAVEVANKVILSRA